MNTDIDWSLGIVVLCVIIALVVLTKGQDIPEAFENSSVYPATPTPPQPYCWGPHLWGWNSRPFYDYGPQITLPHPYQNECHDYANQVCAQSGNERCYPLTYQKCAQSS